MALPTPTVEEREMAEGQTLPWGAWSGDWETLKGDSIYNVDFKPGEPRLGPFLGKCLRRIEVPAWVQGSSYPPDQITSALA